MSFTTSHPAVDHKSTSTVASLQITVLQHTSNEGPSLIRRWARENNAQLSVYHPSEFGIVPASSHCCDLLVILGSPMSPNDNLEWIEQEQELIRSCLVRGIPLFGICFGAQQIAKALGKQVSQAPHKEVGWAPVKLRSHLIPGLPEELTVLHWHEQMCDIPTGGERLFSSLLVENQGFVCEKGAVEVPITQSESRIHSPVHTATLPSQARAVGLQFHMEQDGDGVREVALNDVAYPQENNDLHQSSEDILAQADKHDTFSYLTTILDWLVNNTHTADTTA